MQLKKIIATALLWLMPFGVFADSGLIFPPSSGGAGGGGGNVTGIGSATSIPIWTSGSNISANVNFTRDNFYQVVRNVEGFRTTDTPATVNYYVNPGTGSDLNPCTVLAPCATIAHTQSVTELVAGGIVQINLADATYTENVAVHDILGNAGDTNYGNNVIRFVGNTKTPGNVVWVTSTSVTLNSTSVVFDGITFDGGGSGNNFLAFGGNIFMRNVDFRNSQNAIQLVTRSNMTWENVPNGGNINSTDTGIIVNTNCNFVSRRNLTITGQTGRSITLVNRGTMSIAHPATTLTLDGDNAVGAEVGIEVRRGSFFGFFADTLNISHINAGGDGFPLKAIDGAMIYIDDGSTVAINTSTRGGAVLGPSYFQDGLTTGSTWTYGAGVSDSWTFNDDAQIYSLSGLGGAAIISDNSAGFIQGSWWNHQRTVTTTTTMTANDQQILVNNSASMDVNLLPVSEVGVGRHIIVTDFAGTSSINDITINAAGGNLINGAASYVINQDMESIDLVAITGGWRIASKGLDAISGTGAVNQVTYWASPTTQTGNVHFIYDPADFILRLGSVGGAAQPTPGFRLEADTFVQPITDFLPANNMGILNADDPVQGGMAIGAVTTVGGNSAMKFFGLNGDSGTITRPAFEFTAAKSDGGTGIVPFAAAEPIFTINNGAGGVVPVWITAGGSLSLGTSSTPTAGLDVATDIKVGTRFLQPSAAISAANDLTLGAANTNIVSGNTQVNAIITTGWTAGSTQVLIFSGAPTIKNNTAGGAGTAPIILDGGADWVGPVTIQVVYDGTNWRQVP